MGRADLTVAELGGMFQAVAASIEANVDLLTQADKAIGDGDHGIGMVRGFAAVCQKLETQAPGTVADLLRTVGMAIMSSTGGASGAIFGTLFRGGAKNLGAASVFDSGALARLLGDGLAAVQERGHARIGDKTMVDALAPAAAQAQQVATLPLDQALPAVAEAARKGMEATKGLLAATGKSRTLGERSLGHADPGAISIYLILKSMADYCR